MPDEHKTPGEFIKEIRESRGLGLREAGRLAGQDLRYQTIGNLEKHPGLWDNIRLSTLKTLSRIYGIDLNLLMRIAIGKPPDDPIPSAVRSLEVYPDWVMLPVYGTVSAGDSAAEPEEGEVAFVPREHLTRKGADLSTLRTYRINGDCMVSESARGLTKNFAPGDYIVTDYTRAPAPDDIVIAWWDSQDKLILKRFNDQAAGSVLYPLKPSALPVVLGEDDDLRILGVVIWRGG